MKFTLHSFRCLAATIVVAGVLRETTAQETLTIEFVDRRESLGEIAFRMGHLQVEKDIRWLNLNLEFIYSITLPEGLTSLIDLDLGQNWLTNLTLPEGLTSLEKLWLYRNRLTNLTFPNSLPSLEVLSLWRNQFST